MASTHGGDPPRSATHTIGDAVVEAVADREGSDPAEFDDCLYDVVDPDALESLVSGDGALRRVEFDFRGHRVVVDGDGNVDLG